MAPSSGELWGTVLMSHHIGVDVLLPTGLIVPLDCQRNDTLKTIKTLVWKEARRLPLFARLLDPASYIFVSITQDTPTPQEFYDETKRICDLHLFRLFLKLVEPDGNKEEKMLNSEIGMAIGMPIMQDIERDFMTDSQVFDFRKNAIEIVKNAIKERDKKGIDGAALYAYPPDICDRANLPVNDRGRLTSLGRVRTSYRSNSSISTSHSSCSLKSLALTGKDGQNRGANAKVTNAQSINVQSEAASCSNSSSSSSNSSDPNRRHTTTTTTTSATPRGAKSSDQQDSGSIVSNDDESLNFENLSLWRHGQGSVSQISSLGCESAVDSLDRYYAEDQPVCVWILQNGTDDFKNHQKFTVRVSISGYPIDVVCAVIRKRIHSMSSVPPARYEQVVEKYKHEYILKVCGQELYFISDDYPLCQYRYIRNCLANNTIPQLMMVLRNSFQQELRDCVFRVPNFMRRPAVKHAPSSRRECLSLWTVEPSMKYKVRVNGLFFHHQKDLGNVLVVLGLFHGTKRLDDIQRTETVSYGQRWNKWFEFPNVPICSIPLSARLCITLCAVKGKRSFPIGWGNITVFDYKQYLRNEVAKLVLWPMPKEFKDCEIYDTLNPLGLPVSNPNKDASSANTLELELGERLSYAVVYPDLESMHNFARVIRTGGASSVSLPDSVSFSGLPSPKNSYITDDGSSTGTIPDNVRKKAKEIMSSDPFNPLDIDHDKELIWEWRKKLMKFYPNILGKLIQCVSWDNREMVAELYRLLRLWPKERVDFESALELLTYQYPDHYVREFAVACLRISLSTNQLSQYLLQLVQVLKFEPFHNNALVHYLLERALLNRKIGHHFFWYMKAEMSNSAIALRFGLILEAFCRGCGSYLASLNKQVEALDKLQKLADALLEKRDSSQAERDNYFRVFLEGEDYKTALSSSNCNFYSPININFILGPLVLDSCKIHNSAKRPLRLVWQNMDFMKDCSPYKEIEMIYKYGDDLRQDMLTLQAISIMDDIWQNEGLDLRMSPYTCLATGKVAGLIEVVPDAETVFEIQKQLSGVSGGTLAFAPWSPCNLFNWIQSNADTKQKEELALENFTYSCAGYCVATFILGIGDRHPSNIMVNREGQIFHIDFGHFLGHYKRRFGIRRERTPFVLTEDFIMVIARGNGKCKADYINAAEFSQFRNLCGKAYMALRKHTNLLITLFNMMLYSGIPELQPDDIQYLMDTLAIDKTDEAALSYFESRFDEAYKRSVFTKIDWFFHGIVHGSEMK